LAAGLRPDPPAEFTALLQTPQLDLVDRKKGREEQEGEGYEKEGGRKRQDRKERENVERGGEKRGGERKE